ncbi:hypothetical protein SBOR_7323 [Sclerotinia borealis F-4128]|uniref:Proteophosphoglycan 5 n=1 Tax=Sclerotinia borealis (strain F-4128) TaxID=1432307 RepID=W9C8Z6_SCLBF|nr:hypothetical protein SBOR_7323 [Sclerotinia borealis F-4128]
MSSMTPHKGQHQIQNFAAELATTSPQYPQNSHDFNSQAYSVNTQSAMTYSDQPTTPPRTPRRVQQNQPASQSRVNSAVPDNSSRKSTNKRRPKNVQTSPVATRNDRTTPPLTGAQSTGGSTAARPIQTPSAAQVYAGPTFHASPAPSALPMPSFYSKSVPESPAIRTGNAIKEPDSSADESSQTPSAQMFSGVSRREESPLDLFFKADKREKAEKIRARSTNSNATGSVGPFNLPLVSPGNTRTPPQPTSQYRNKTIPTSRGSASGVFSMELDGSNSPGLPLGPAFSTPYNERILAARKISSPSQPHNSSPCNSQPSLDNSEALKAYLFSADPSTNDNLGPALSSTNSAIPYQGGYSSPSGSRSGGMPGRSPQTNYKYRGDSRSTGDVPKSARSGLRQEVTPTKTPTRTPDRTNSYGPSQNPSQTYGDNFPATNNGNSATQVTNSSPVPQVSSGTPPGNGNPDLRGMENDLRRMLKLDSPGFAGSAR